MEQYCKGIIRLVRGDTLTLEFEFDIGEATLNSATLNVLHNFDDVVPVLTKDITNGILNINHSESLALKCSNYVYNIKLEYGDEVRTATENKFIVLP